MPGLIDADDLPPPPTAHDQDATLAAPPHDDVATEEPDAPAWLRGPVDDDEGDDEDDDPAAEARSHIQRAIPAILERILEAVTAVDLIDYDDDDGSGVGGLALRAQAARSRIGLAHAQTAAHLAKAAPDILRAAAMQDPRAERRRRRGEKSRLRAALEHAHAVHGAPRPSGGGGEE